MSDKVRDQYEAFPYPSRNPADEAKRLIIGSPSNLAEVNHYLFAGRRDFTKPFRALVAGGGTGDATIMLAQQLANEGDAGEVVYLDLSTASRAVAEARAAARGLTNIRFVTGSLLEAASLGLGSFDYIDCCGVLHHLPDPAAGLAALTAVLGEGGGMGIMVYGTYGRSGVYPLQAVLRRLVGARPLAEQVSFTRRLLGSLPATNLFLRNPVLRDHTGSDAELVDLLLHSQDRSYTVPEIGDLIAGSGLNLISFIEPLRYEPATYLKDPVLLRQLGGLDLMERATVAEQLAGNLKTQVFYLSRRTAAETLAWPDGPEAIPVLRVLDGARLAKAVQRDLVLKGEFDGLALKFALPRLAPAVLPWIDGRTSLGEIQRALHGLDPRQDWDHFKAQFDLLYQVLGGLNHLLIRYPV